MKKCETIEEGVKVALDIYQYNPVQEWRYLPACKDDYTDKIWINGKEYPLFWWRCDTQIESLYLLAPARKPCSMKLNRVCSKKYGLERLLYKELDISEYVLRSEINSVMNYRNGQSMNMLAKMKNECVAVFELAATMNEKTEEQGRHSFWGTDGMASDKVVSQKIASEAVYVFTDDDEKPQVFNDIFLYMYGLAKTEVFKAVMIAKILMEMVDISDWIDKDKHYRQCIAAAADSNQMGKKIFLDNEV